MTEYKMRRVFPVRRSDEDMTKILPKAAEELLRNLFDLCEEKNEKPDLQTLEIKYKHAEIKDGPLGKYAVGEDGEWSFIRAELMVKIEVKEEEHEEAEQAGSDPEGDHRV